MSNQNNVGVSDCFTISFDINENLDIPVAVVGKQSSNGFFVVNVFHGNEVLDLYEYLLAPREG